MSSVIRWSRLIVTVVATLVPGVPSETAADWPMLGRDVTRNAVVADAVPPTEWNVEKGQNIKWVARLGSTAFASPVVAGGHVYIGTNNIAGYLKRYPPNVDLGCLLCFDESDGKFLWQYSAEKLPSGRVHDWPLQGLVSSPLVEGDRLWFVSNRNVVVCLDAQGFRDGENDGPYLEESVNNELEADVVWEFDLIGQLGVFPHPPGMGPNTRCSIAASYEHRIYVVTGNGTDETFTNVPAPGAPSLVCFDKNNGQVLWTDASPGANILDCQPASPLVATIDGRAQVIVPQGDGWLRSFDAVTGQLIWQFDINPKESKWILGGLGTRNYFMAPPVLYQRRIYIASGQQAEHGSGSGRLVCIDPTRTGDISSELAVDSQGAPLPPRRLQAVDPAQGERAIANPNSGLVWEFTSVAGSKKFDDTMHRMLASVAIHNGLLIAPDFSGLVLCLDAATGKRYWSYDVLSAIWASPLIIGDIVYVADEDGEVALFRLSPDPEIAMKRTTTAHNFNAIDAPIAEFRFDTSIHGAPVFANNVLFVPTRTKLFAIETGTHSGSVLGAERK